MHEELACAHTAGLHRGIGVAERRNQFFRGQTQRGQARLIDFHQNPLFAHPGDLHLADAFGRDQAAAQVLGYFVQFLQGQAFAGQGEENSVDVAEIIIDQRRVDAWRQLLSGIVELVAQLVPDLFELIAGIAVLDFHADFGLADHRARADFLDLGELLDGAFQRLGDFLLDLDGGRAGVLHRDDGFLDGEFGVFQAAHLEERDGAADQADQQQHPDIDRLADGVTGYIHLPISAVRL